MKLITGMIVGLLLGSILTVSAFDWNTEYQRQQAQALQQLQWQQQLQYTEQHRQLMQQQWNQAIGKGPC